MNFNADELAVLASGRQNLGVFFRLDTTPIVRIWLGAGPIEPGVNTFDLTGARYDGFGQIPNLPAFKQMLNGAAERVEFTVSGVSGEILQIASGGHAEQVRGKRVAVGFGLMAEDWSLLGPVKWLQNYIADFLSIQQAPSDNPSEPIVRTVSLSCRTQMTGRRRPGLAYFSNVDQQTRYPGDLFCSRVPFYALGFQKSWPRFS